MKAGVTLHPFPAALHLEEITPNTLKWDAGLAPNPV